MIRLRIYLSKARFPKKLRRFSMLGAWIASWAGAFIAVPLASPINQPVYLQPILRNPDTQSPVDQGEQISLDLLPDLRTLPPFDLRVAHGHGGTRELRLANTIWNSGQGHLELLGEFNSATSRTRVHQRITTSDGNLREHFVGEFVWHPGHEHWHFDDFTIYELWSLKPNGGLDYVTASSDKLSYCVIDTDPVDRDHPAFSPSRNYFDCGQGLQGLSAGWGDTYKSHLDGQALDITALPGGYYALISRVNPENILLESDYGNNEAVVLLEIRGSRITVITPEEIHRVNCRDDCWS